MPTEIDDEFYERADEHIHLANAQMANARRGVVSASFMYAAARFNAYVSACNAQSREHLIAERQATIDYFTEQYRLALTENLDDYISCFDDAMAPPSDQSS
ncbi:MAG: DUF3144 domain-containing protein [Hyphomicrobium sp.]|nr:DUF3144 domain-containing protein [Hyphomicrobium sp.]